MPLISVVCPACAGKIQLDDAKESGFCLYCGNQVLVSEAIQKTTIKGEVSVSGIASLEKMLHNAESFHKLGYLVQEQEILVKLTQEYPGDYRAWWRLAELMMAEPTSLSIGQWASHFVNTEKYEEVCRYAENAKVMAPSEVKATIEKQVVQYYEAEKAFCQKISTLNNQAEPIRKSALHKQISAIETAKFHFVEKQINRFNRAKFRVKLTWAFFLLLVVAFIVGWKPVWEKFNDLGAAIYGVAAVVVIRFLCFVLEKILENSECKFYENNKKNPRAQFEMDFRNSAEYSKAYGHDYLPETIKELSITDRNIQSLASGNFSNIQSVADETISILNTSIQKIRKEPAL